MRGAPLLMAMLLLDGCETKQWAPQTPTRWPNRCVSNIVPFIAPFGRAGTEQVITFHFRAVLECNAATPEVTVEVQLVAPDDTQIPVSAVTLSRGEWLGEQNVLAVHVTARIPEVHAVRALFTIEGETFTRDVLLVASPASIRTLDWSQVPLGCDAWWDLGPDERYCSSLRAMRVTESYVFGDDEVVFASSINSFAWTQTSLVAGNTLVERGTGDSRQLAAPHPVAPYVTSLGDELLMLNGGTLLRVDESFDGGLEALANVNAQFIVGGVDTLMLALDESHVEFRPRTALASPGTVRSLPGTRSLYAGRQRLWADDGARVTVVREDGSLASIERPSAGLPRHRETPGPTRPMFIVPTVPDSPMPFDDEPYLWIPIELPDGGLGSINVAIDGSDIQANDEWLFSRGRAARIPAL